MTTTRREMLRLGLGGSTLLACGTTVPTFLARSAHALADGPRRGADGRILVVIQLDGGNDGLNTVVPHGDDIYHKSRPKLALKSENLKPIDEHVGLHPSLSDFAKLREDGRLAIVQSVGYPNPNRSHSESMAIWQTARLNPGRENPGWLARAIDASPAAPGGDAPALHIATEALPQSLRGGQQHVPSLATIEQFRRRLGVPRSDGADEQRAALDRIANQGGSVENPLLQFVARSTVVSYASSARLENVLRDDDAAKYPDTYVLAKRLRLVARLIRSGLSTPIYYAQLGGFDTHAEQLNRHSGLLRELSRSVQAFLTDLDRSGDGDRVAVLVFSEFGRRLRENASAGTDHGTSAPVFLLGRAVQGGLHGPYPDLAHLKGDDPEYAIDFRRVYATVLGRWLKLPAEAALGEHFEPLPLFRS
ncbi:DUF1501 domain-containing protein [Singulisphaera sp. Ch08]|uniref:DUF1501 domain-containing protein n=1 Tax=Singulisphaera sp. Ch08 TaxID=3120278 RepID=A0AAU7CSL7_9BACT